jgi:hypothetical protein
LILNETLPAPEGKNNENDLPDVPVDEDTEMLEESINP